MMRSIVGNAVFNVTDTVGEEDL